MSALTGGALIGLAASALLFFHGKTAGVSGILGGLLDRAPDGGYRVWFLGGLLLAGLGARAVHPQAIPVASTNLVLAAAAGLLVGIGTQVGSGCTSGHGVCGLSRLSKRSLVATVTFMAAGALTVAALRAFGALP